MQDTSAAGRPPPDSPFLGLRSRFVDGLPEADRLALPGRAARLGLAMEEWAARFPCARAVRARPLALSVAAAAPFVPESALLDTARLSLWVFALDDLFDEGGLDRAALRRRAARYKGVVSGLRGRPGRDAGMAAMLAEVLAGLAAYPLFLSLRATLQDAIRGTIDAMLLEDRWRRDVRRRGPAAWPSVAAYLAAGRWSIGGPPHIWAAVLTAGEPGVAAHMGHLGAMEERASRCIRLANDLRSADKERAEGTPNVLSMLAPGASPDSLPYLGALAWARGEIARLLDELRRLRALPGTPSGRPEAAIAGIASMVSDYYASHDYHASLPAVFSPVPGPSPSPAPVPS